MTRLLIIGAGGVGSVAAQKASHFEADFSEVHVASRSLQSAERAAAAAETHGASLSIDAHQVDADDERELGVLLERVRPAVVLHVALPYQNLPIMRACVGAGAHYIDTACPEVPGEIWSEPNDSCWYGSQWAMNESFHRAGVSALLGIGSDPGMVNVFASYARKHWFDRVQKIDILDVNAGEHGHRFATNFNSEINLREVQAPAHYWEDGRWHRVDPLSERWDFEFPIVGKRPMYLMDHDELHSLCREFPEAKHIKFWMGFGDDYIRHFRVLEGIGMLDPEPAQVAMGDGEDVEIAPLKLLEAVLPDPASLAARYTGKTCIGTLVEGIVDDRVQKRFVYNVCDHTRCYEEVGSQAISYTAAAPAVAAAVLVSRGEWRAAGVRNAEQMDPDPFMSLLAKVGLPWDVIAPQ